jgi:hypothetical protein
MHTIKALVIAAIGIVLIYTTINATAAPSANNTDPLYILRVTSEHPQAIEGSYFTISGSDSAFVQIKQKTPFELKVRAQVINAVFRTAAKNSFIRLQLLKQDNSTAKSLLAGKGHALIANSHFTNSKDGFIIAR